MLHLLVEKFDRHVQDKLKFLISEEVDFKLLERRDSSSATNPSTPCTCYHHSPGCALQNNQVASPGHKISEVSNAKIISNNISNSGGAGIVSASGKISMFNRLTSPVK